MTTPPSSLGDALRDAAASIDVLVAADQAKADTILVQADTIAALTADLAAVRAELAECQEVVEPAASCRLGFAGPLPIGALAGPGPRIRRVYLRPGDPYPAPITGVLDAVTYKVHTKAGVYVPGEHDLRAQQAKAYGADHLLGYRHEPEHKEAGWNPADPGRFLADWAEFVDALFRLNVKNVRTYWCLMASSFKFEDGAAPNATLWWPGNVDVVGADGYDWCGCKTNGGYATPNAAHRSFGAIFADVELFAEAHGDKPIVVGEFGTPDGYTGKADWIAEAGTYLKTRPAYEGACYFQHGVADGFQCNWALAGDALAEYAALMGDPYFAGVSA